MSYLHDKGWLLSGLETHWIAEAGCADTSNWTDAPEAGYWYNHATYNDLVLSGVVGIQPTGTDSLTVNPLVPPGTLRSGRVSSCVGCLVYYYVG